MHSDTFHRDTEENILLKTHQHKMILILEVIKYTVFLDVPLSFLWYLGTHSSYSTLLFAVVFFIAILFYKVYLWSKSWLIIGNQKVTLLVRNGIFSQYAMNIRYANMRDCAVSKGSILSFFLKYGTLYIRSSAGDVDNFYVHHVPKVGNVYSLINTLSQFSIEQRQGLHSLEDLYTLTHRGEHIPNVSLIEENKSILTSIHGITNVIELVTQARKALSLHEEVRNHGVHEVLRRKHVLCFLHDSQFRMPAASIVAKTASGEVYFPGVPFPEVKGKDVISASPGELAHKFLTQYFPYIEEGNATVLVGWND